VVIEPTLVVQPVPAPVAEPLDPWETFVEVIPFIEAFRVREMLLKQMRALL